MAKTKNNLSKEFWQNFELWIVYYRKNIHRFIMEFLGIYLHEFQQIAVYCMDAPYTDKMNEFMFYCARGIGKSWLCSVWCIAKAILYPGIEIKLASANVSQAKIIISKIITLSEKYPMIKIHITKINFSKDHGMITFRGGSKIETCVSGEGSRGNRAQILVLDESRLMFKDDIQDNLRKFLTGKRTPLYLGKKKEYQKEIDKEHNTIVYLTSIGYKNEWSFRDFVANTEAMASGKLNYGTMSLPYQFGVECGIITEDFIESELSNSSDNISSFKREMEVVPGGITEHSLFDYNKLAKARKVHTPIYPLTQKLWVLTGGNIKKSPYYVEKQPGELRVLTFDIAYAIGRRNDNSGISIIRLLEDGDHYIKSISYLEVLNGWSINEQAIRIKEIFYDCECDYIVMDPGGSGGIAMLQMLGEKTFNVVRNIQYPGWRTYNGDSKFDDYVKDYMAEPVMYCMPSSASNIHYNLKIMMDKELERNNIFMLVSEREITDELNQKYEYLRLSTGNSAEREEAMSIIQPYVNTSSLIDEAINAKLVQTRTGKYTINEGQGRKDRIMSVLYGIYFIVMLLEKELDGRKTSFDYRDYFKTSKQQQKQVRNPFASNFTKLQNFGRRK